MYTCTQETELVQRNISSEKSAVMFLFLFYLFCCIALHWKKSSFMDRSYAECSSLALHCLIKVSFPIQVEHGL